MRGAQEVKLDWPGCVSSETQQVTMETGPRKLVCQRPELSAELCSFMAFICPPPPKMTAGGKQLRPVIWSRGGGAMEAWKQGCVCLLGQGNAAFCQILTTAQRQKWMPAESQAGPSAEAPRLMRPPNGKSIDRPASKGSISPAQTSVAVSHPQRSFPRRTWTLPAREKR